MKNLFIFLFIFQISICFCCPPGTDWKQSAMDSNKCYKIVTERKNWFDAEIACKNLAVNSHLTSVNSAFEMFNLNAIVAETAGVSDCDQFWIGANDFDENGNFKWTDGLPFRYSNWDSEQPDSKNRCVQSKVKSTTGKWKTKNCSAENCFICENYEETVTSTTTSPSEPGCDLSTLKYDIALLFDVGVNAVADNNRLLSLAKDVALAFSANFILGENDTQFALLEYSDLALPLSNFNTYKSHSSLNAQIRNGIGRHGIDGSTENRLESGFQAVIDYLITPPPADTGYRPDMDDVNHLVIFFSTKVPENIFAARSAAKALTSNYFCNTGIASNGVDLSSIAHFAKSLNSSPDIASVVTWLQKIACSRPVCMPTITGTPPYK